MTWDHISHRWRQPVVTCWICGACHSPFRPTVDYRSYDLRWECADKAACYGRSIAAMTPDDRAAMYAAFEQVWAELEREGWRWPA